MKPRLRYGSKIEEWHKKDLSAVGQAPVAGGNSKHNIFKYTWNQNNRAFWVVIS